MDASKRFDCVFLAFSAGCFESSDPAVQLDSGPPPDCHDANGDGGGYGAGDSCLGPDCDEADSTRHDGSSACDGAEPETCCDGPRAA